MAIRGKTFELPSTISETIYQYMKKAIINREFKPNQRLQEKEIAKLFNVSSTPVREAFFRLAAEDYLVIDARKQVLVKEKTLEEVKELYEVVRALDIFASKKAINILTIKDIDELKRMTKKLGEYYKKRNIQNYLQQNLKIHDTAWQSCGNKFLYETLSNLMEKISMYRMGNEFSPFSEPHALEKSYRDHLKLLKAIESKNIVELEKLVSAHWGEEFFLEKRDDSNEKS
jgi:DNA-binding GntR family transcriptional regulator